MNITVFGMGYVGCVTAACLADLGHDVTGVDVDANKVDMVNRGQSPIIEPGLAELIKSGVAAERLRASTEPQALGDIAMICVGTPSNENGSLGLRHLMRVMEAIGELLRRSNRYHVITVRSTVLPGTVENGVIPLLEETSSKVVGRDFGVCMNPEFMRETTAVQDFHHPPFTIIGQRDQKSGDQLAMLYKPIKAPVERPSIAEAEMVKYACNAFHATKVCFGNEIGTLCKSMGIDSHRVMDIFCKDTRLNLSPYYLRPGFAFGGSCLPKDLRAITYQARRNDVEVPLLSSLMDSNDKQIQHAYRLIKTMGRTKIGVLGLSFKLGTDDVRESPVVILIEMLIGKGYAVSIYDEEVSLAKLHGANKRYLEETIPHVTSLMESSVSKVLDKSDLVIVSKKADSFRKEIEAMERDICIVDFVRLFAEYKGTSHYEGIAW
ncbi:MAG TPA: UDP-glucose/GDP-mannose dehydrogenase family protein [Nitrospira sp.]|nr:UDP-glucose/GDP-mannose dehydrogenase family protein [Nitrospira sp.]